MKKQTHQTKEIILSIQLGLLVAGFLLENVPFFVASLSVGVLCNLFPFFEQYISALWLFIGKTIGVISKTIILTVIYYALLTPLGLLKRLFTKDQYYFHRAPKTSTWHTHNKTYSSKDLINPW